MREKKLLANQKGGKKAKETKVKGKLKGKVKLAPWST